ncbi:DUF3221 domain-containing protein [Clostridium sp.]|uniref:DUF3221 domain-containing protein n=1 Tax=Clostridium sp. TaxID=1506 RepID=UPI002FC84E2E
MNKLIPISIAFTLILSSSGFQTSGIYNNYLKNKAPSDSEQCQLAKISVRGIVKEINMGKDGARILVEGVFSEDTLYDKAYVFINHETTISKDNLKRLYDISEIKVGNTVEVMLNEPLALSYPVQGGARSVRIVTQPGEEANKPSTDKLLTIAYNYLSEEDKGTLTDWKNSEVEEYIFEEEHLIMNKEGFVDIKGKELYRVVFNNSNDALLGPIIISIDKNSLDVLGIDLRH